MNKQPTTEYVTRTYLSFRPVLRTGYKRVRARGRSTKESGEADTCRAEVLLRDHSSMVQGRNARGVGYCAALCLFLVTGGYPSPPSFWSNICPRKNKSLLSLTTGRASLVSNRALFNRRRITDPESIQAPYSLSLSLFLALLSLLPSLLSSSSSSWCFFRESPLSCPVHRASCSLSLSTVEGFGIEIIVPCI